MDTGNRLFGNLEQFTPGPNVSFTRYVDRAKVYFRANGILESIQIASETSF